jgi:TrmH family RNA methyltransferase
VIREIAGRQNHSVKLARKLQKKKHRRERGLLVGEGMDLLVAALEGGADVREVLVRRELAKELPAALLERAAAPAGGARATSAVLGAGTPDRGHGVAAQGASHAGAQGALVAGAPAVGPSVDIGVCDQETLDYASSLGGSADVIFLCAQPVRHLSDVELSVDLVFFLDGIGDPGNVGTLVRSAAAFGLGGVICSPGTADPYSPKALRGGMGAQFALPVVTDVEAEDLRARVGSLAARGAASPAILVADPKSGVDVRTMRVSGGALVVLGSERSGPGEAWGEAQKVTILQSRIDSLNVAMAGTVLAYELSHARG